MATRPFSSRSPDTSRVNAEVIKQASCRFIKLPEVKMLTTLSTSEIYRRIAEGRFPKQITLGPKSSAWIESEVISWLAERVAESRDQAM